MSNYRGRNGTRLEQIGHTLGTSEELLDAIETISGVLFEMDAPDCVTANVIENAAWEMWQDPAGREVEILAAIPVDSAENDDEVIWGTDGVWAEFDGEKWILK